MSLPIARYMEICIGMIGMSPNDFWESSPKEIYRAIQGFIEFNTPSSSSKGTMSRSELDELMELYPD